MRSPTLVLAALAALSSTPLCAQGIELVGLTRGTPAVVRQDPATCRVAAPPTPSASPPVITDSQTHGY